jgi:predicted NBD/HSP70 family sugar kinase
VAGIGLELEADCLVGVIAGLTGDLVLERHVAIERPPPPDDDATADMLALVDCLLAEAEARQLLVAGACVSVPGVVDQRSEPTFCASRLGWRPADLLPALATGITARFGRPPDLNLEVESNLVALAEARSGGHGSDVNLLCVVGGNGVSAGAIIDGSLRRGASGYLGEVGHMVVDPDGIRCCCGGRGCWETVVGMPAILQEAAPDLVPGSGDLTVPPQLVRRLVDRAAADDARAVEGLAHVGRWLGVGLASLINILNPSTVVLCGYFRELAPWTLGPALAALHRHGIAPVTGDCQVVTSRVIGSSAALGAAMLASCGVFEDPTTIPK